MNPEYLPPDTIIRFFKDGSKGYGRIMPHSNLPIHQYEITDIIRDGIPEIYETTTGAKKRFQLDSVNIIQQCGDLTLQWKIFIASIKETRRKLKEALDSIEFNISLGYEFYHVTVAYNRLSIDRYFRNITEEVYLKLILSHREWVKRTFVEKPD